MMENNEVKISKVLRRLLCSALEKEFLQEKYPEVTGPRRWSSYSPEDNKAAAAWAIENLSLKKISELGALRLANLRGFGRGRMAELEKLFSENGISWPDGVEMTEKESVIKIK